MCLRCSPGLFRHSCGAVSCHTSSMAANPHLALTKNSSPTTLANERRASQNRGFQRQSLWSRLARREIPAGRSQRNTQSSQSAIRRWRNPHGVSRKAAVPTPSRVVDGGLFVHPTVGRGILDAPTPHPIRGRQGCRPLRRWCSAVQHGGGTHRSYVPCRQFVCICRAAPACAAVRYRGRCLMHCGAIVNPCRRRGQATALRGETNRPPQTQSELHTELCLSITTNNDTFST